MKRAIPTIREDAEELKVRLKRERDRRQGQRLQALYLLQSGQACDRLTVATQLGVDRNTVGEWLSLYATGGLSALLTIHTARGARPTLSRES